MKILLLGAAGFIGTNLTIELAKKTEDEITLVDPPLMEKPMNQKPSLHQMEHYQKFYENGEYVRAVESTTEQNYNMIDGCANNLPKPRIINGRESVLDKLRIRQMAREKQKSSRLIWNGTGSDEQVLSWRYRNLWDRTCFRFGNKK